ncbi:MAG: penicillin acylase family protein [Chitinophagales bacterium]
MKYLKLLLSLAVTLALVYALNNRLGTIPPLAKFMNPFTGFWQNAADERSFKDETFNLTGLKEEVKVYYDNRLVPHVFAKNNEDLYFMQGYITARHRLFQMELSTYAAAGRVCELIGEQGLDANDKIMRRIGMGYGAEKAQEFISKDPESKKLIDAYCAGVNAYINSLNPAQYPVEYKLLDFKPEEWKPIKVGLLLKYMANMLSIFEYDIENANFVAQFGKEEFRQLYPDFIADEDPIIPIGTSFTKSGVADLSGKLLSQANDNPKEQYSTILQKPDEITGSNNWAVSGSKTKSGKPILCNDPHLRLTLPSIWYEMQLVSPAMNVYGATLPGSPCVVIGFNDSIAWGVTNGGRDVRDWYHIKYKDANRDEYEVNGQWKKTTKRVEEYHVRGKGIVRDTVIYTEYGPVVFDQNFGNADSKKNLSMSWVAHLPSNEFKTFYLMNQARNYDDYLNALSNYTCPAQNFVFASQSGDIAIKEQGRFPIRDKATEQGKYISEGSTGADAWTQYIPYADNPTIKNPARGFVSSANQHPTDSTYPYYFPGVGVYENYRNRRINQLLSENNGIDADFMKKMQSDNFNLHAKEAAPVLLALLDRSKLSAEDKKKVDVLEKWDYFNNANQVAPVYFEIWWNELRKLLWDEMLKPEVPMKQPNFYVTVQFLKNDSTSHFYDNDSLPGKQTRSDIVLMAFNRIEQTLQSKHFTEVSEPYGADETSNKDDLNPHDWGSYKDTRIGHMIPKLDAFSSMHVYNGGNLGIINATNTTNGPSWRMIVDFGDKHGYVVYPGGESGNPGSKFYDNMVQTWAKGEYFTAKFLHSPADLGSQKLFESTYKP